MKKYIGVLKTTRMFAGVGEEEIEAMLSCLGARLATYPKGAYVVRQGERIGDIMMLVQGSLHIQKDDYWGNRSLLGRIAVGDTFAEAYLAPDSGAMLNDVVAVEESAVMLFDVGRVVTTCSCACRFHHLVMQNVLFTMCDKNRALVQKLGHISKRSTRDKLMSYLSEQSERCNSAQFCIPFNRQQLADFLSVDRSAMSNELCRMRDEGLLEFDKNNFKLL